MGLIAYHMNKIMGKRDTKSMKWPTAQEMAVSFLMSGLRDTESDDDSNDMSLLENDASDSKRASGFGFLNWVGGLFSDNIAFWFHGAQSKGRDRRQTRVGSVPLYRSALLAPMPEARLNQERMAPEISEPAGGEALENAIIDGNGIAPLLKSNPEENLQEIVESNTVPAVTGSSETESIQEALAASESGEKEKIETAVKEAKAENEKKEEKVETVAKAENEKKEEKVETEAKAENEKKEEKVETVAKAENKKKEEKVETVAKAENEKKEEEKEEEEEEEEDEEKRSYIDVAKREISIAGEDQSVVANAETGEISVENGDLEVSANLFNKTFRFSWGKGWSSDDEDDEDDDDNDEDTEENEESSDKTLYAEAKEAVEKYYKEVVSNSEEALGKLGFAKDALIIFFRTGELPENKYDQDTDKEEDNNSLKLDAELPIVPGLTFVASLEPEWSFGFHFDFALEQSGEAPKVEVEMEGGRVKRITAPDIERILSLTAEVQGKIGATLRLALRAGVGYLFYLEGGLFATGEAKGILEGGSEEAFGRGKLELPITMHGADKKITTGDASMKLDAGIGIFGSIGGDITAASEIFDWEKELWSTTFKEWNPANFGGAIYLKQDKNKGGLFNPLSWEKEKSEFSIELFKKHIEGQKKYGLVMTDATPINMKIDEGKVLKDRLAGIHDKLAEIEAKMSEGAAGGQYAAQNSEAYDALIHELEQINLHMQNLMMVGNNRLREMQAVMLEYQQDEHYKENTKKAQEGKAKHMERLQKMQEWGGQFGEGQEEARNNSAYTYYENTFQAKGASRQKKDAQMATARNSVATKEALLSYENERVQQLGQKHNDRIAALTELLDGMNEEQRNSPNPEFITKYRNLGGTAFLKAAQQHAGKDKIIAYEKGRLEQYNEKHRKRAAQLEEKMGESGLHLSEADRKKPNRAFAQFYYKEMNGKRFFSKAQIIHNHQNGEEIVSYERARLYDKAGENMQHIEKLEQFKARYDKPDATEEEKTAVMKEAQEYYKTTGTSRLGHFGQRNAGIAAAASKQDILDYEIRRLTEYQAGSGKKQKSYPAEKDALDKLKGISATDAGSGDSLLADLGETRIQQVWDAYKDWLKEQKDDTIKELIPLPMILEYENKKRMDIRDSLMQKKKTGTQIAEDKAYKKHQERYQMLQNKVLELEHEQNQETIENETKNAKEAYFSKASEFFEQVKKGDTKDARLLKAVLERKMNSYGGVHADRLTKLREFMGIEGEGSNASESTKSDAQVWEYYKSIGGGSAFADDFAKRRNGKFSIEDMLRYEQHAARESSQRNAVTAAASRKVKAKIADYTTKEGGAELEEQKKKEREGGHYDRYMALKAKLEAGASDQEMVTFYLGLGGGKGYVESLMKGDHFLDVVTPDEILNYEKTRNGKEGERHARRLQMLAGLDDSMSDEEVYKKYQESVLEDHSVKEFASKVGVRQNLGFDATVRVEEVVTPQMIFDYEKKRLAQVTQKHTARIERLSSEDVTAENVLSVYQAEGGGKRFFDASKDQVKQKAAEIGNSHDFQDILDYEQVRIDFYQNIIDEINEPLKRIEDAQNQLQQQIDETKADWTRIQKYLGASGKTEVFSSHSAFETFKEENTGAEAQGNAGNKQEQADTLVKKAEDAQKEAEQIKERMKLSKENVS